MALRIPCPHCGSRPHTEFWCGGELRFPIAGDALEADFERVWMRDNKAGIQAERWYHVAGCRRWLTLERDTRTNRIVRSPGTSCPG